MPVGILACNTPTCITVKRLFMLFANDIWKYICCSVELEDVIWFFAIPFLAVSTSILVISNDSLWRSVSKIRSAFRCMRRKK